MWDLRVRIHQFYPGISYADGGMQAVLANKLSVPAALSVPAPTRGRITWPQVRVLDVYVAMLLRGTHNGKRKLSVSRGDISIQQCVNTV